MKKFAFILSFSAAISAPAFAVDQGFYVAIDQGLAIYSNAAGSSAALIPDSFGASGAIRIGGGYHFNPYVGVEAGYSTIGDATITSSICFFTCLESKETLGGSTIQIAAVGTYPINKRFNIFGKLGWAQTDLNYTLTSNYGVNGSTSGSKTNLMFGLGWQFNFNQHWGIRARYEDFGKVQIGSAAAVINDNVGVTVYSVGGIYNF